MATKPGPKGRQERNFKVALLVALGKTRAQIQAVQPVGNSTFTDLLKDAAFQELVGWIKTHLPETTPEIPGPKTPTTAGSPSPDLKTLASKTLQAVSRGLDSEDPRTALQAASLFLQNYVGGDTI